MNNPTDGSADEPSSRSVPIAANHDFLLIADLFLEREAGRARGHFGNLGDVGLAQGFLGQDGEGGRYVLEALFALAARRYDDLFDGAGHRCRLRQRAFQRANEERRHHDKPNDDAFTKSQHDPFPPE